MDDRELLELAAKAAGIKYNVSRGTTSGWMLATAVDAPDGSVIEQDVWRPLTDDGDALRLLVATKMNISWLHSGRVCCIHNLWDSPDSIESSRENVSENTRRAIVRAAAEIGRAMP